jgi:hypothetical protein
MDDFPIIDRLASAPSVRDRERETLQQRPQVRTPKRNPADDEALDENDESAEEQDQHQLDELV